MSLPPTRQLEAFMAVAEARSFRVAADRLGMSQPALSQNIALLEAHLGTALFLRSTRSVRLTAEGAEFHGHLVRVLPALQAAVDRTRHFGKDSGARLRLGFLASAAVKYLPGAMARFRSQFPDVAVFARDDTADGLFTAVQTGELDLAVSSFIPHKSKDVDFERILADPFMALLRRDHPLAGQAEVSWADLLRYDFIGANAGSGTRFATDAAMRAIDHPVRTKMDFNHHTAVAGMVEAGMGVSAVPGIACPPADHPVLCSIPLVSPVVTRDLGILTNTLDGRSSGHVRQFRACLIATAAG